MWLGSAFRDSYFGIVISINCIKEKLTPRFSIGIATLNKRTAEKAETLTAYNDNPTIDMLKVKALPRNVLKYENN